MLLFRKLKDSQGQGLAVEYVMTFFLVVAVIAAMSIYFRRTIQGRIRDSMHYMSNTVRSGDFSDIFTVDYTGYQGDYYKQYEPYYAYTNVEKLDDGKETRRLIPLAPGREIAEIEFEDSRRARTSALTQPGIMAGSVRIPCYNGLDAFSCD